MAELNGSRVAAVLAANTNVHVGTGLLAQCNCHFHQLANAGLIQLCKGIVLENLCVVVSVQELACIVSGEAVGHLGQVVCTEAEELSFLCNLVSSQCSSRNLDHGTNLVLQISASLCDLLVSNCNNDVLYELQLLDLANQRNHDFRNDGPVRMSLLHIDGSLDDSSGLHLCNFRIGYSQTAATVTHHGVELVQGSDDCLDGLNGLALCVSQCLDVSLVSRNEFVERRIQETDGNRVALQRLVQCLEVSLLHGLDLSQSSFSFLNSIGADHLTECCNSGGLEEHVLGTAKTDTLSAQLSCLLCISRCISVGANLQYSVLVSPSHDSAELTSDGSVNGGDDAVVDVTGGAVDGDVVALSEGLASQLELLVLLVHLDVAAAGYTAGTHTTCNNGCVGGHTAANGQDALGSLHTGDILRRGLQTNQNDLFALCVPSLGIVSGKYNLAACSAGRCAQTLADRRSSLQCLCVELGVQQGVQISRVDHQNSLLLVDHALVNQVASDLQCSLCGSLTVTALEHVQLLVLNGELHILHITVVILQSLTNLDEFSISLRELLLHLCDGHRCTNTCNHVLALCVDEELAHELLLAGCGITGKCNAGTGLVVQVAEYHGHYVNGSTPGVGNVVVTTVNVCSGVVPGTEYSLDSQLQLLNRVRGEVLAQLVLVLSLELLSQGLQILCGQVNVELNALFFLHLVDELLKVLLADFHNHVGEHLDETSVGVIYKALECRIRVALDHSLNHFIVQAQVQDGVHHTGHGSTGTGTNGNQKGVLEIAELLAVDLFHLSDAFHSLCHDLVIDLAAVLVVLCAGLGGDGEALGYRKTDTGHLSQVRTLAAQQVAHGHVAFAEHVNPFVCHW